MKNERNRPSDAVFFSSTSHAVGTIRVIVNAVRLNIRHMHAMRLSFVLIIFSLASVGLAQANPDGSFSEPVGVGGQKPVYGSYTQEQIVALQVALTHVKFPAEEGTVGRLIAKAVKPLTVEIVDWYRDLEKKGRLGGEAVEYWLNHDTLVRVATAYYSVDGKHFNLEEWAVILTRTERKSFTRRIYPY